MKKRGTTWSSLFTLTEVVGIALVAIILGNFTSQTIDNSVIHMKYFSRELSMATLLVEASPYPITINYSTRALARFNYSWQDSKLAVARPIGGPPRSYPFLWDRQLWPAGRASLSTPSSIFFSNNRAHFIISNKPVELFQGLECKGKQSSPRGIFIDPAHGEEPNDLGLVYSTQNGIYRESELMCRVAEGVSRLLQGKQINSSRPTNDLGIVLCEHTFRRQEVAIQPEISSAGLVLSLRLEQGNHSYIKAYVPYNEGYGSAKYMACRMLNSIKRAYPGLVEGIAIIPVEQGFPIRTDSPAIMLELGGIASEKTRQILDEPQGVWSSIAEVLNE